ncbi:MAG: hypothetical protein VX498_12670 [Myxococcota bacterium]|nr:hypothetical protein [Myxococcota bacterium]
MGPALLTAAEASGDGVAAPVLAELLRRHPDSAWTGFSGPAMDAVPGFSSLGDVRQLSGAGLVELLPRMPALLRARRELIRWIDQTSELSVFVDAPDLHLPLARRARQRGGRTVQLVSPQFWAWRPGRRDQLARDVNLTLCLFPFEVDPLRSVGAAAHWVGHPLADRIPGPADPPEPSGPIRVALLPGSRPNEVRRNLRPVLQAIDKAKGQRDLDIRIPWRLDSRPPQVAGVRFEDRSGLEVLAESDLAIAAFGTATLEAALLGIPTITVGSAHPLSSWLLRGMISTRYFALPNILLDQGLLPEHLLPAASDALVESLEHLFLNLPSAREQAVEIHQQLRPMLGGSGFAHRVADCIEPLL